MQLQLAVTEPEILRQRADALWQLRLTGCTAQMQVYQDCARQLRALGYVYPEPRPYHPCGEPDADTWGAEDTWEPYDSRDVIAQRQWHSEHEPDRTLPRGAVLRYNPSRG